MIYIILFLPIIQINFVQKLFRMIRIFRCLQRYSLDKVSMNKRTNCFYPSPESTHYHEDTINYAYNLALHPGNTYEGIADIRFHLQKKGQLFMDFGGKQVKEVLINSKKIKPEDVHIKKQGRINIPQNLLKAGINNVCIKYQNQYDNDGSGCVSFIDVDKKQYLYTQFEPYMGNRVFPMFDQPNLKAKMDLSIACPSQWETVLSNEDQNKNKKFISFSVCSITKNIIQQFQSSLPSNYKVTNFNRTKLLPTYLFCFVVGPYKKYVSQNTYKNIPMNLYCIESLYPYMMNLVPFIQQMTNKSMQFFQKYFGYPYPFSKYDQVFAHQYKWGAMENAGIVTLNDLYIFKDPVSTQKMISFGNTIVHQMAHHWFGNLVTMKWWDDLWLNQSFAQYISHFCLEKIKSDVKSLNYQSAMASFLNRKGWGYAQDQLVTTHPIQSDVANTQVAQSIFDGITYSKGAATMKQLMYLMGQQAFSKALKQYFNKFEFKNAQLTDLLRQMEKYYKNKAGGVTINDWRQMWLEKAGLNILSGQLDQIKSVYRIKQTTYHQNHKTLRSHTIKIGLVHSPNDIKSIEVIVQPQQLTQINLSQQQLQSFKKSKAILLNHEDLSFCKVVIDQKSINYLKDHLNQIKDLLFRSMVWKNFFDMVKDGHLKSTEYMKILQNNLFQQISDAILEQNLNYSLTTIQKYTPKAYRQQLYRVMFDKCKNQMEVSQNRKIIIRDKLISFANVGNNIDIQLLIDWYNESSQQLRSKFGSPNKTQRWRIIIKVLSSTLIKKQYKRELLQDMIRRDNSDTMKNKKYTCESLLLDQNQIQNHFKRHTQSSTQKWGMTAYIHSLAGLNSKIHEKEIRNNLRFKYFEALKVCLSENSHNLQVLKKSQMIQLFIDHMDPNMQDSAQDLQWKGDELQKIRVDKNDKIKIQIMKKIDLLKKRTKAYRLFNK